MLIGMIIPDQTNPFFAELSLHLQTHLAQLGVPLVVLSSDGNTLQELACLQILDTLSVSGIVFVSAGDNNDILEILRRSTKPHIIIDRELPEVTNNCDFVLTDNTKGIWLAVEHLVARGHRSLAFIQGCQNTDPGRTRMLAFKDAANALDIPEERLRVFEGKFDYSSGFNAAQEIVQEAGPRPTAVVASNDLSAIGALQCFHQNGVIVPRDISLIGFDDITMCQWLHPRLTTIRQEQIELTRWAAEYVLSRVSGEYAGKPRSETIVPRLIERESTRNITLDRAENSCS
jgi:LacI family transcriptional regulator